MSSADVLTPDQLVDLAHAFAGDPTSWTPHVRASTDPERRHCHALLHSPYATVWLLCWMPGQETGFHDHDGAGGAVVVVRGTVVEQRLRLGGEPSRQEFGPHGSFTFDGSVIHNVGHSFGEPAVTIHAYSPALRRMGAYDFDEFGQLRRRALDEDFVLA